MIIKIEIIAIKYFLLDLSNIKNRKSKAINIIEVLGILINKLKFTNKLFKKSVIDKVKLNMGLNIGIMNVIIAKGKTMIDIQGTNNILTSIDKIFTS